jgi:hypothetical protein
MRQRVEIAPLPVAQWQAGIRKVIENCRPVDPAKRAAIL